MENKPELNVEQKMIVELGKVIKSIREQNFKVHKRLILESETNVKLYTQILQQLNRQNQLLDEAKQEQRLVRVSNAI